MNIHLPNELTSLEPLIKQKVDGALQERESLGLSIPQNFDIVVRLYGKDTEAASALIEDCPKIDFNVLLFANEYCNGIDKNKMQKLIRYCHGMKKIISGNDYAILASLKRPLEILALKEACVDDFDKVKEFYMTTGLDYDEYKRTAPENRDLLNDFLSNDVPKIADAAKDLGRVFRHEIDHIDSFGSQLCLRFRVVSGLRRAVGQWFKVADMPDKNDNYVRIEDRFLRTFLTTAPVLETRAIFFDHVNPDEWKNFDLEEVKKKILDDLVMYSYKVWTYNLVGSLANIEQVSNPMNRYTVLYINKLVLDEPFDDEKFKGEIDFETANKISKQALDWQWYFDRMCKSLVGIIGEAYRDDPSRLKEANKAKNLREYVEICKPSEIDSDFISLITNIESGI